MIPESNSPLSRLAAGLASDALSDGQLLVRFLDARDEAAFTLLVRRHGPMVLGVGRRVLGNPADADDAFQAAFLVLARKARTLTDRATVGDWLYGVAYTTALKARAAAMRRRTKEAAAARREGVSDSTGPSDWTAVLDRELARLPEKYREPVVLCELEDQPRRAVAARLGIPEGTLSSRLATAKRMLADRLGRRGVGLPAGGLALLAQSADGSVSPELVAAAVRVARVSAGHAAGTVPAAVLGLSQEVTRTMFVTKLMAGTAVLVAVGLGLAGAGAVLAQGPKAEPAKPVAEPKPAAPAMSPEAAWKAEFRKAYGLADGQLLKRVGPPYPKCRDRWFMGDDTGTNRKTIGMIFFVGDDNGKELNYRATLMGGIPNGTSLLQVFDRVLLIPGQELHIDKALLPSIDKALLETPIPGDFVVRDGTPVEKLVPEMERILRDECQLKVRLSFTEVNQEVVVARGKFASKPLEGRGRNEVHIYAKHHLAPHRMDVGSGGEISAAGFFTGLGNFIDRRVVSEAEGMPREVKWRTHIRSPTIVDRRNGIDTLAEDTNPFDVLARVAEQTGLTFTFEQRKVRVLSVDPDKPDPATDDGDE